MSSSDPIGERPELPHLVRKPKRSRVRRIAAVVAAGIAAVLLLAFIAIAILLNDARVHRYLLATLNQQASDSLGVRVTVQNFVLHLETLSVELYGVSVSGAAPYPDPPLLQVEHAEAGVRIVSILSRTWYLDSVRIDRPVIKVFVDSHGVSNLPTFKSKSTGSSNSSVFDLGIRHVAITQGAVFYNDRPSALSADLHNLEFHASLNSLIEKYSGTLSYSDGQVVYGIIRPIPHNLDAEFDATPTTFHLSRARLTSGGSQLNLTATLNNYENPVATGQYNLTLNCGEVRHSLRSYSMPTGILSSSGSLQYNQKANRTLLQTLTLSGELNSRELDIATAQAGAAITNMSGHFALQNGDATLHDLRASLFGGALNAQGQMTNLGGDPHSKLTAQLQGIQIERVRKALVRSATGSNIAVAGVLNAKMSATWGKTFDDLIAHSDATISGQASGNSPSANIPINSELHVTYTASAQQVAVGNSYVRTPQTNLAMNGIVSHNSGLNVQLHANDLHEVELIADLFRTPSPGHPVQPLGLGGSAIFEGTVQGSAVAPHLSGQFTALNLRFNGSIWKVLKTNVDLSPSSIALKNADLEPATRGRITFNLGAGLDDWSFNENSPIQVDLHATQMNVADVTKLAGQQIPVTGELNANITLHGTELHPLGNGSIALSKATAYDEPVTSAEVKFSGSGDEAQADVSVQLPAGSIQGKTTLRPRDKTYEAQLTSTGIQIEKLQALKTRNIDASGAVKLNASGRGTFDNPQMSATVQIPSLVIQGQTIDQVNLQLNVADHMGNATLTSSVLKTSIQAKASAQLTGDFEADASVDTQGIPLQPVFAIIAPEESAAVTGQTEIHATMRGPLKNTNAIEAHVTVPILKLAYNNNIQLAAVSPIHIDYANGTVHIQKTSIRGTDTDLQIEGTIPMATTTAMSLSVLGTVNMQLAQLFSPDIRSSGELKFDLHGSGVGSNFGGQIQLANVAFSSADLPVGLQQGNGSLTLAGDRLEVSKFQGTIGGGSVTAQGGVTLRPKVQFNLGLSGNGIRILYPDGMRESLDANLRLAGGTENAVLGGTVNVSDLSFTPAFDLSSFISQLTGGVAPPPSQGLAQNIQLNLAVHSTNNVNLVSRSLSVNGAANLQVRGTAAYPVILGRVNLTGGDIILNGNRFVLTGGTVQFVNPSETEPVVNVTLTTNIQQYDISMRFHGPVDQLRPQFSSNPALPEADIINLLALGQTSEARQANSSAGLSPSTTQTGEGLVAGQVSSELTGRISKIAGISQLSINPVLAGGTAQGPPGANITIQQRVTSNLFVTFTTNAATTQSQTIQGQYQISPRVALSATRDPNGGVAVDALIKKSW